MAYWEIDGVQYDMNFYLNSHPGGRLAILLGEGRDCTQLIKSYHPNIKKYVEHLIKLNLIQRLKLLGNLIPC